jgi:glycosyltransferase involved in cell wall biosynthesis
MDYYKAKVSVIIPVYNVEKYLEECLESVINQTLSDIEIICVNDGSTDNSLCILTKYAPKDKRIKIINQKNGGLSSARNAGLLQAQGEYIYFLDSDDYITTDALKILYEKASLYQLDVLRLNSKTIYENNYKSLQPREFYFKYNYLDIVTGQELFASMIFKDEYYVPVWLYFVSHKYLKEMNLCFLDGIIHEDNHFTFMLLLQASKVSCVDNILYYYRIRKNSIMEKAEGLDNLTSYSYILYKNMDYIFSVNLKEEKIRLALMSYVAYMLTYCQNLYEGLAAKDSSALVQHIAYFPQSYHYFFEKIIGNNICIKDRYLLKHSLSYKLGHVILFPVKKILLLLRGVLSVIFFKG